MMNIRWIDMFISLALAIVMWSVLSGTGKTVSTFEVRLDYRGLPQDMAITSQLVNSISVRVSGSAGMMRSFANRTHTYTVDLSGLTRGENVINISKDKLPFKSGADIEIVEPPQLLIMADSVETKTVPLVLSIQGEAPMDYAVSVDSSYSEISVRGASSLTAKVDRIELPVDIPADIVAGSRQMTKVLPFAEGITLKPSEVPVTLYAELKRKAVKVTRHVVVDQSSGKNGHVDPKEVEIYLELPLSLASDAQGNQEIIAYIKPKSSATENDIMDIQVTMPKGAVLKKVEPAQVLFYQSPKNNN